MGARAIWKGRIRFGDVDVPVKLYSAVQERGVHFRLLHAADHEPVRQELVHPETDEPVAPEHVRKAFEAEDGRLVLLDDEELEALEPESGRDIEVARFVPPAALPHPWYDRPYYLGPDGSADAYAALAAALHKANRRGIAHWVMRNREYTGALHADGDHLMLITLRHAGGVVDATVLEAPGGRPLDRREVAMAKQLVDAFAGDLDMTAFRDEYRDRVLELVEAKAVGKVVRLPAARAKRETRELAGALERSLKAAKQQGGRSAESGEAQGELTQGGLTQRVDAGHRWE